MDMEGTYVPEDAGPQMMDYGQPQLPDEFQRQNDLRVIQEYNREDTVDARIRSKYWSLFSKSIKLGFWEEKDNYELFLRKNCVFVANIMAKPKHKLTFQDIADQTQVDLLFHADVKRGLGMEKHRINERILQASHITQNIQGGGGGYGSKKTGVMGTLKGLFA